MFKLFILYITLWSFEECETNSLPEQLQTPYVGCYGIHVFQPYCASSDTVIAVRNTFVGSKLKSTGCPVAAEMFNGVLVDALNESILVNETECCRPDYETDCISAKTHEDYVYQVRCTGLTNCSHGTAVFWEKTKSNSCPRPYKGPNLNDTNYMFMEYYCIQRSSITLLTDNIETLVTTPHYLQNPGYPSNITFGASSINCSVTSDSCGVSISIYTIDIRLVASSGVCQQSLSILVGNQPFLTWDCDNQTYFNITNQNVPSKQVTVKFTNQASVNGGQFWIGFKASDDSNLRLSCPGTAQLDSNCENTTTQPEESNDDVTVIIIGAVVSLVVLALVTMCLVWYCFFRKRKSVMDSKDVNQNSVVKNEEPSQTVSETLLGTGFNGGLSSVPPIQHDLRVPSLSEQYGRLPPIALKGVTLNEDKQMKSEMTKTIGRNNDVNVLLPNQTMTVSNSHNTLAGATNVSITNVTEDTSTL